jgi:hypothetical protein
MVNGKRSRVAAHWEFLAPVEGAFVKTDVEIDNDPFRGRSDKNNPTWICIKAACEEGGLMEFEDFWNPPQPPSEDCDNNSNNDISTQPPLNSLMPHESAKSGSGVQGGSIFAESLERRNSGGVQGGSTVQGIGLDLEKNKISVLEKPFLENPLQEISTSFFEGGQSECRVDSFEVERIEVIHDEVSQSTGLTLGMLIAMLKAVENLADLESVEEQAKESQLDESEWKRQAWEHLDDDTKSRLRSLRQASNPDLDFCLSVLNRLKTPGQVANEDELNQLINEVEMRSRNCSLPKDFCDEMGNALGEVAKSLERMDAIGKKCLIRQMTGTPQNPSLDWVEATLISQPSPPIQTGWIFQLLDGRHVSVFDEDDWKVMS